MEAVDSSEVDRLVTHIRALAAADEVRITIHAHQRMVEEGVTLDEVLETVGTSSMLENYPEHRRGPCCLLNGFTGSRRPLHVVCTTTRPELIIITAYEPKPPKWLSPTQRSRRP